MKLIEVDIIYLIDVDDTLLRTTEKIKVLPTVGDNDRIYDLSQIENNVDNVYADADRFIDRAKQANKSLLAYSHSDYPDFQTEKFNKLVKRPEIPLWITGRRDKARELGEHYDSGAKRYLIDRYAAQRIVLIDDKKLCFVGLSELPNAAGVWIDRGLFEQPAALEPGVATVFSLDEIDLSE
jgi:hypothetical protein